MIYREIKDIKYSITNAQYDITTMLNISAEKQK